jgi:hypothetical protein
MTAGERMLLDTGADQVRESSRNMWDEVKIDLMSTPGWGRGI